jgi:hypothetical protein
MAGEAPEVANSQTPFAAGEHAACKGLSRPPLRRQIHSRNQRVMLCSTRKDYLVVGSRKLVVIRRAFARKVTSGSLGGLYARWDILHPEQ